MKKLFTILTLGLCSLLAAGAVDSFSDKCSTIGSCAKLVSQLTAQKYIYEVGDAKAKITATANLELHKENAEILFTQMLALSGFSRVPVVGQKETYTILKFADARDSVLPVLETNQKFPPNFGQTYDLMTMKYKMTNPESMKAVEEQARAFARADVRIVASELTGVISVTATAQDLRNIYQVLRENDVKSTTKKK